MGKKNKNCMLEFSPVITNFKYFRFLTQFYFLKCSFIVLTSVVTKSSHYLWWPLVIFLEWRSIYFNYSTTQTQWAAQCINLGEASATCANTLQVRTVMLSVQCLVWVGAKTGIYLSTKKGRRKTARFPRHWADGLIFRPSFILLTEQKEAKM